MATKYVSGAGADSGTTGPFRSIEYALISGGIAWGDTLLVQSGASIFKLSGSANRIVIDSPANPGSGNILVESDSGIFDITIPSGTNTAVFYAPTNSYANKFILSKFNFTNTSNVVAGFVSLRGNANLLIQKSTIDNNNVSASNPLIVNDSASDIKFEILSSKIKNINANSGIFRNYKVSGNRVIGTINGVDAISYGYIQYMSGGITPKIYLTIKNFTSRNCLSTGPFSLLAGTGNKLDCTDSIFETAGTNKSVLCMPAGVADDFIEHPENFVFDHNCIHCSSVADHENFDRLCVSSLASDARILPVGDHVYYIDPQWVSSSDSHSQSTFLHGRGSGVGTPLLDPNLEAYTGHDIGAYKLSGLVSSYPALSSIAAFVGDSIMAGSGLQYPDAVIGNDPAVEWAPSESRAACGGLRVEGLPWLVDRVMLLEAPGLIFISAGVNNGSSALGNSYPTGITPQKIVDLLIKAMRRVEYWGGIPVYLGLESLAGSNIVNQASLADSVNAIMAVECASNGWVCGSILDEFRKNQNWITEYYIDLATNVHPNTDGYTLIADYAYNINANSISRNVTTNPGSAKQNITRTSGTSTNLEDAGLYTLPDSHTFRTSIGWTWGVDHWAYNADGTPKTILGSVLIANGGGDQFFCGAKRIAGYSSVQVEPSLTKIKRLTGV